MLVAGFPGSFDPPSFGHLNIIERASALFNQVYIIIAVNSQKKYLFSPEERLELMQKLVKPLPNVKVELCSRLVVDYLDEKEIKVLLRGVRGMSDFAYEFDLSMMNRGLNPNIETIFIPTDPKYFVLRSSTIKELASFHGDISGMVPPLVAEALAKKYPVPKA